MTRGRDLAVAVAAILLLSPAAHARWVFFPEDEGTQRPDLVTVDAPAFFLVEDDQQQQMQQQQEQPIAILEAWESVDSSLESLWSRLLAPLVVERSSNEEPQMMSLNPIPWMYQQLEAADVQQRAALSSLMLGGGGSGRAVVVEEEGYGQAATAQQMLRNVGCSRFRPAMQDYGRQQSSMSDEEANGIYLLSEMLLPAQPSTEYDEQASSSSRSGDDGAVDSSDAASTDDDSRILVVGAYEDAAAVLDAYEQAAEEEGLEYYEEEEADEGVAALFLDRRGVTGASIAAALLGEAAGGDDDYPTLADVTAVDGQIDAVFRRVRGSLSALLQSVVEGRLGVAGEEDDVAAGLAQDYGDEMELYEGADRLLRRDGDVGGGVSFEVWQGLADGVLPRAAALLVESVAEGGGGRSVGDFVGESATALRVEYFGSEDEAARAAEGGVVSAALGLDGALAYDETAEAPASATEAWVAAQAASARSSSISRLGRLTERPLLSQILAADDEDAALARAGAAGAFGDLGSVSESGATAGGEEAAAASVSTSVTWSSDGGLVIETYRPQAEAQQQQEQLPRAAAAASASSADSLPFLIDAWQQLQAPWPLLEEGEVSSVGAPRLSAGLELDDDLVWSWTDNEGNLNWGLLLLTLLTAASAVTLAAACFTYLQLRAAVSAANAAAARHGGGSVAAAVPAPYRNRGARLMEPLLQSGDEGSEGCGQVAGARTLSFEAPVVVAGSYAVEYAALHAQAQGSFARGL